MDMFKVLVLNSFLPKFTFQVHDKNTTYGTCQKKLYEIRGLSASEIRRFSAASPRISAESCKGVRGIVSGCPRNR